MTRGRPAEAPDLHDRFGEWLQAGAPGEPARDVAVHAAHCPSCRALIAAWDQLELVDTGRAPMPPSRSAVPPPSRPVLANRALAATAAALLVVAVGAWIGVAALRPGGIGQADGSPTPDQEVLGGFGAGGTVSPTESASHSADFSASPSASVEASTSPVATPGDSQDGQPVLPTASPRPGAPVPTARPTTGSQVPNPTPTSAPTQPPSAPASATPPTASPSPATPPPTAAPTPTPEPTAIPTAVPTASPTEQASQAP